MAARSSACGGRAERDLAPVQAEHEVVAAGALDVVARHEQRSSLGAQLGEHRVDQLGAGGVHARERLVEQQHGRVLHQRPCQQGALALAARQLAERNVRLRGQADPVEGRPRGGALTAPRRQPPAAVRERAHQRHVQRAYREVEPGALGLRDVGRPAAHPHRAGERLELSDQGAEERGLAAAVGSEHAHRLAGLGAERDVAQDRAAAVAGGEALGEHGRRRHRATASSA